MSKSTTFTILIVVFIAAVAYGFYTHQTADHSIAQPVPPATDSTPTDQPNVPTPTDYMGLTEAEAQVYADGRRELFRVVEIDGETQMTTRDYRPGRINAVVENGFIVSYTVEGSDETQPGESEPVDTTEEPNTADHNNIVGMTQAEAEAYAATQNIPFRIGMIDGEFMALTMDYRPGRITASIKNGVVVEYSVE